MENLVKENAKYYDLDFKDFLFKTKPKGSNEYEGIKRAYITNLFNKKSNPLKELIITPDNFKFTTITFNKSFERICETYLNVDDKSRACHDFRRSHNDVGAVYLSEFVALGSYKTFCFIACEVKNVFFERCVVQRGRWRLMCLGNSWL